MANSDIIRRQQILNKTNGICAHCGKKLNLKLFTIDHYIPKAENGSNKMINLIPLCRECNVEKGHKVLEPRIAYPYINMKYEDQLDDLFYEYCELLEKKEANNNDENNLLYSQ